MRRILLTVFAAVLGVAAYASEPQIRDINIDVTILRDGTAHITEVWDLTAVSGTEWYLVRENLGDIEIRNFSVSEGGTAFVNEGDWDTERSLAEKAGRCGIHRTGSGRELCWGLGSYGDHVFTVSYDMTRAAKSLQDYDSFHVQLIGDELSSAPKHAKATVGLADAQIDSTNARIWGFGFYGESALVGGKAVFESDRPFSRESSMIVLMRLDKGLIEPVSVKDKTFEQIQNKAFRGSDYKKAARSSTWYGKLLDDLLEIIQTIVPILVVVLPIIGVRRGRKKILGMKKSDVMWSRDIPFGGDLAAADYILEQIGEKRKGNYIASAMILRMIQKGCLSVTKDGDDKVEIHFGDKGQLENFSLSERQLWAYMKEAAGSDEILQNKEFGKWSKRNTSTINDWVRNVSALGEGAIRTAGLKVGLRYTPEGQAEARKALGLKKFLTEATLIKERTSGEVILWEEYLVWGAMFGIADKVAAELKDINPTLFEKSTYYDYNTMRDVIYMSDSLARSITSAKASYDNAHSISKGSIGGFGGGTSFGGGGGFSGGGHGGGCR